MKAFLTTIFPFGGGKVTPVDPDPVDPTYDTYKVGVFKVVDNYVGGKLSANTGLSYDKSRRLIYSSITPSSSGNIRIFNEDYELQGESMVAAFQGHTYNHNDDTFIRWVTASGLQTYTYDGTLIKSQGSFDPYGDGTPSGSLGYNEVDDEMAVTSDGGLDILIFKRGGTGNWVFDRSLGNGDAQEGVCYDEDRDAYWYNRASDIALISKTGTLIKTIPRPSEAVGASEGLAYNPFRKTLYMNSDRGYHGGITNGNRCIEVWPGFYD